MKPTATSFKPGQHTSNVWCGDIVSDCEFIRPLTGGGLLFWDHTFKTFRRVHMEEISGSTVLNGWTCQATPFST